MPRSSDPPRMPAAPPRDERKFVTALARGLEVLRAFRPSDGVLGNQEIAARTGLPKPTVSRITYTLTELGYLTHLERLGKYQLAPTALSLGYAALANLGIREVARPHMQALADLAGASVALGSRDRLSMLYVAHCRSAAAVTLQLELGSRIPLATTAMGRAYLAALSEAERAPLLDALAERHGPDWPAIEAGIAQAVSDYAKRGFVLSVGSWQPDVNAVGTAIRPADGSGLFAFNCGAPAYLISRRRLETEIGPRLVAMVRTIEAALGGRMNTGGQAA